MSEGWFYMKDGQSVGPFSEAEVVKLFTSKMVFRDTLFWSSTTNQWQPLSDAFPFARSTPPPLPTPRTKPDDLEPVPAEVDGPSPAAWTDVEPHPWRRYFARMLDAMVLGSVMWFGVGVVLFALNPDGAQKMVDGLNTPQGRIANSIGTAFLAMFPNALLIGYFGSTPGKWLFGIHVAEESGRPIGLARSMQRELRVWVFGLGLAMPLISLFTLLSSFSQLKNDGHTSWDRSVQAQITHRQEGTTQYVLTGCGIILLVGIFVILSMP